MISRFSLGLLPAVLALAVAAPLHAAPTTAALVNSMTYHIERHNQQVVVKDANEKTLTTFSVSTTNLQGILIRSTPGGGNASAGLASDKLTLVLEDQSSRPFWSTPVPIVFPLQVSVSYNSSAGGTQLVIAHQSENTSDPNQAPMTRLTFVVGSDGRPLSFGDQTHRLKYVYEANGFSIVDQDGKVVGHADYTNNSFSVGDSEGSSYSVHLNQDGTGTMLFNGTKIAIDVVTKDGKTYRSFPWNGHKVTIESGCNWNVTTDGDLTVNAPSTAKTTASK